MSIIQILFVLPINLISLSIVAQNTDNGRKLYDEITLFRYGSIFKIGEEKFNFNQLKYEFKGSELGLINYNNAKKYRTISTILRVASLGSLYGIIKGAADNNRQQVYIFLGIQTGLAIGGGVYLNMSNQSLDKAIYYRNKDYLFPK